jgi:hypothetical protein
VLKEGLPTRSLQSILLDKGVPVVKKVPDQRLPEDRDALVVVQILIEEVEMLLNVEGVKTLTSLSTILEHLVAEGYADTNESAIAIMANMSEEWRQSIVEMAYTVNVADVKGGTKAAKNAQAGMKDKSGNPMYNPGVGVGPDFKLKGV